MKSKHEINFNPNWDNNELQFARLLSELTMTGAPTDQQMQDLQESMDRQVDPMLIVLQKLKRRVIISSRRSGLFAFRHNVIVRVVF